MKTNDFKGMKVLVMGLGINGGGVETARYLAGQGAEVTVTDLRDEKVLAPSMEKLEAFPIRYVLGRHETGDFRNADMVIKNPGVKPDSPYLKATKRVETDLSLFLAACPARLLAVTGSKGKSSTSSALFCVLNESRSLSAGKARLGGNITLSPLSFLHELEEGDDVVLELSSWQLGDLRGRNLLKPRAAVITPIMRDHLDRYGSMDLYVADKRLIYQNQDRGDITVAGNDGWGRSFHWESRGRPLVYSSGTFTNGVYSAEPLGEGIPGGWIPDAAGPGLARLWEIPGDGNIAGSQFEPGSVVEVVPAKPLVPGIHQKQNLLAAALALLDLGLPVDLIRESLGRFEGIKHRLEFFHESGGIRFYNDSAATIPEAAAAAVNAFERPRGCEANLVLVSGGTDKELDFAPLAGVASRTKALILLAGTGSEKLRTLLDREGVRYRGPFDSLDKAINAALEAAAPGDNVVLSPGCASFGMFINEFDRGDKWKEAVRRMA